MTELHTMQRWRGCVLAAIAAAATLWTASCATSPNGTGPHPAPTADGKLTGRLLVAAPTMSDPRFAGTVVFVVRHDDDGAMGFVINRPIGRGPAAKLLEGMNASFEDEFGGDGEIRLQYGGPVQPMRGYVLHSSDYHDAETVVVTEGIRLTANTEILRAIASGSGPSRGFMAMGYAGWQAGQLEREIRRNDWITVSSDDHLVLDGDAISKWRRAMARRSIAL